MIAGGPSSMSVPSGIRSRSRPAVVMFSPSSPNPILKPGFASDPKSSDGIRWTCRRLGRRGWRWASERADVGSLPELGLPQRLLPIDRPTGIVAVRRDHLGVKLAGERHDMPMRQLVRRRADEAGAPFPFGFKVGFRATEDRLVPILGLEGELDLRLVSKNLGQKGDATPNAAYSAT
jgi:hypothetical protein